jgi:hypothetical protein
MIDGRLFLGLVAAIAVAAFLNGLRFARMAQNPWAGKTFFGKPVGGSSLSVEKVRRLGLIQMIAAPIVLLLFVAMCFGLFGPMQGIQVIRL